MKFLPIIFLFSLSSVVATELSEFKTDYCTFAPDGTLSEPNLFKECCLEHDLRYWFGGTKKDQSKTDILFKTCIKGNSNSFYAALYYNAVRLGHLSPIKNKSHWGWGWMNEDRDYFRDISGQEKEYIINEVYRLPFKAELLEMFLQKHNLIKNTTKVRRF